MPPIDDHNLCWICPRPAIDRGYRALCATHNAEKHARIEQRKRMREFRPRLLAARKALSDIEAEARAVGLDPDAIR